MSRIISTAMSIITIVYDFMTVSWNYISGPFWSRIMDMLTAPYKNTDMLWMLIPLLTTMILMEFYFGRYKEEELGWNTAFGNALILIFVAIDTFRHIYEPVRGSMIDIISSQYTKIIISMVILGMGLFLMLIDFFHFVPKKAAYIISSPAYINLIALLGIIIVYSSQIPLDAITIFACILLFFAVNIILELLYIIIPAYHSPLQRILTVEDIEKFPNQKKNK